MYLLIAIHPQHIFARGFDGEVSMYVVIMRHRYHAAPAALNHNVKIAVEGFKNVLS